MLYGLDRLPYLERSRMVQWFRAAQGSSISDNLRINIELKQLDEA